MYYNKLSHADFTYGNILLLYCIFNKEKSLTISSDNTKNENIHRKYDGPSSSIPDYIIERINICIETFNVIMNSKPDKSHTSIIIISKNSYVQEIKEKLIGAGISEQYLEYDTVSKTIESVFNSVLMRITKLANPPCIYFIGSIWQKDVYNSIVTSKLKEYKVFFEGALDDRPYEVVQKDKLVEEPKKGSIYYKNKITNKAIDVLLNYIFPKNKDKTSK